MSCFSILIQIGTVIVCSALTQLKLELSYQLVNKKLSSGTIIYWKWTLEKYYFIFYHKIRDSSCLVPLADDGVTDSGYAWESEDGADDGNTAEEINRHRNESSE